MITHVAMFKLKDPNSDRDEVVRRLRSLDGNVPVLRTLEVGVDALRSERSYDVSLIATFDSIGDLAAYTSDPFHREVAGYLATVRDLVAVVDYES